MHSNTEGLNPTLSAQLGVGWNRSLPAAFQFGNGITPDGANDVLISKKLINTAMPDKMTFSIWFRTPASMDTRGMGMLSSYIVGISGVAIAFDFLGFNGTLRVYARDVTGQYSVSGPTVAADSLNFFVFTLDFVTKEVRFYLNGLFSGNPTLPHTGVHNANNIQNSGLFELDGTYNRWNLPTDEAILYNRILSLDEIRTNYNNGLGCNPGVTEGIIWWYDFQVAESDSALHPGGNPAGWTAGAWGIRDKTPNDNHAMQQNFAANNLTLGGAISAF